MPSPTHLPINLPANSAAAATNPAVDAYLHRAEKWRDELTHLRRVLLGCALTEDFKWGKPCYTFQGHNVVIFLPLKECCALLFAKGALLPDPHGLLIRPTENMQAARQLRLTGVREITRLEPILQTYVQAAIAVQASGREVSYKPTADFAVPAELRAKLDENPALKTAYDALTPGRQRGYLLYFSAPRQSATRASRVEKCTPQILAGKGLHDR